MKIPPPTFKMEMDKQFEWESPFGLYCASLAVKQKWAWGRVGDGIMDKCLFFT